MRANERGSALILAVLVMVILTLLGISFLLLAETENRIAENEKLASQALYFAESGTRAVLQWFNDPQGARNLANPPLAALDRTLRQIDDDGDPATAAHDLNGTTWLPYKQGVDRNADGIEDVFDRPYRKQSIDTFMGLELGNAKDGLKGPDMRIDGAVAGAAHDFLDLLSERLMAGYPAAQVGVRARIARIDIYAPPYLRIGGDWTRFGLATVKVVGQIVRTRDDGDEILAERIVKAVVNEIPYSAPYGSIHSCGSLSLRGQLPVHWGPVTAITDIHLDTDPTKVPASLFRVAPAGARIDLFTPNFDAYRLAISSPVKRRVEDPWLRVLAGGVLTPAPPAPSPGWEPPLDTSEYPSHEPGAEGSRSNLFQDISLVGCPELDYDLWKTIATSGQAGVEYWAWAAGDTFRRDGVGDPRSFRDIAEVDPASPTSRATILFFDTTDGFPPHDDNADGIFENFTPDITVDGGTWSPRGVVYLNAESLRTSTIAGRPEVIRSPGEPFQDSNSDGVWQPGEIWINLDYATSLDGSAESRKFFADPDNLLQDDGTPPVTAIRNAHGPEIPAGVSFHGILYLNGTFDATGPALYYGSVIARGGVLQPNPLSPTVEIYWNEGIVTGKWPPPAWGLPRVVVTRWETDL